MLPAAKSSERKTRFNPKLLPENVTTLNFIWRLLKCNIKKDNKFHRSLFKKTVLYCINKETNRTLSKFFDI